MTDPASSLIGLYGIVKIIRDLGTQSYRLISARSAADSHLIQLRRAELEVTYWISQADNFQCHSGSIPDDRLKILKVNAEEFNAATQKYGKRVKLWCERLSVGDFDAIDKWNEDIPEHWISSKESLFDITSSSGKERHHRLKGQGKSLSLIGRIGFVLYGENRIKNQAKEVAALQQSLSMKCIAESKLAESVPIVHGVPATRRESKLMQFISLALERVRTEAPIRCFRIYVKDAQYQYTNADILDPRMKDFAIPEYDLPQVSLTPLSEAAGQGLEPIDHCIVVSRSPLLAISQENYKFEAEKIARLFAEDEEHSKSFLAERSDSDVLRCCGMVLYPGQGCDLLFKLPPGSKPFPRTLRQALTDPGSSEPIHPLSDRIRFIIRMVAGLFVVHSLGLVHKRVHPETIVVVEPLDMAEADVFPHRLGHPYLTSLQLARTDNGKTKRLRYQEALTHRSIYFHPRDQYPEPRPGRQTDSEQDRRLDEYRPRDDIFSLGVCMFEVVCWKSLLVWKERPEVQYDDYVHDNEFVPLSDNLEALKGLAPGGRAKRKVAILIDHVTEKVPKALGKRVGKGVADIIVSFLRAGYENEAFGVSLKGKNDAEAGLFFLNLALKNLRTIYKEMKKSERSKRK